MVIVFVAFWLLFLVGLHTREARATLRAKSGGEWVLDGVGLLVQGLLIPVAEVVVLFRLLAWAAPGARGALHLPPVVAFALNFVAVDYLYYWNHRLLHARRLWRVHAVHHSITSMDVLGTSRNVLWCPLLIVYLWANATFLFVLDDTGGAAFALSASITAALDLWRHSRVAPAPGSFVHRALAIVLVTPNEHAWHHARDDYGCNYGANLSLWDRLHRTWKSPDAPPAALGVQVGGSLAERLLAPRSMPS